MSNDQLELEREVLHGKIRGQLKQSLGFDHSNPSIGFDEPVFLRMTGLYILWLCKPPSQQVIRCILIFIPSSDLGTWVPFVSTTALTIIAATCSLSESSCSWNFYKL